MTPIELNRKGFQSLVDTLVYVDAVRFIKQFDNGQGDYTKERDRCLGNLSLEEIWADLQKSQDS